mmetsp:Transcript_38880/g.34442  ORF Transcript_38880/g.34442 Transcript_38880/m.34442 type:complete len:241 (-) Transcript_38880:133-855(-)
MATNTFKINNIDERTKDIVNGYTKNVQLILPQRSNPYFNIPSAVYGMITIYYHQTEHFSSHGSYITLNQFKDTIKHVSSDQASTVYGKVSVTKQDIGKHIWKFKIIEPNVSAILTIGIDSSSEPILNRKFFTSYNPNTYYGYQCYANGHANTGAKVANWKYPFAPERKYGQIYSDKQNEIRMELFIDNKGGKLQYYVNNEDQGVAFEDIEFDEEQEYKMCISLDEHMTIKLVDYQYTKSD